LGFTFTDAQERGLWFPRIEAFCQYKKPARFNDLIEVELTVEELREKSVKYGFKIFNKESNTLLANGYVVIVAADQKMGKAAPIPKDMVEKLQPFCKQGF